MDIKEDIKKNKPVLGLERAMKRMRNGKISRVYVSSNSHAKDRISLLGKSMNVQVILVNETSKDLGVYCKKPFSVSVISFE